MFKRQRKSNVQINVCSALMCAVRFQIDNVHVVTGHTHHIIENFSNEDENFPKCFQVWSN